MLQERFSGNDNEVVEEHGTNAAETSRSGNNVNLEPVENMEMEPAMNLEQRGDAENSPPNTTQVSNKPIVKRK